MNQPHWLVVDRDRGLTHEDAIALVAKHKEEHGEDIACDCGVIRGSDDVSPDWKHHKIVKDSEV
jgi:hypothetical protein